jgi:hypothetical protein
MGVGPRSSRHYLSAKFPKYDRNAVANRNITCSSVKGAGNCRYKTTKYVSSR